MAKHTIRPRGGGSPSLTLEEGQVSDEAQAGSLSRAQCVLISGGVASVAEGGLPVWEIVRSHRKLESLEVLDDSLHGVGPEVLATALAYARAHREEIDGLIDCYERTLNERLRAYRSAR